MIWKPMFSEFSVFSALVFFTLYALICSLLCRKIGWHTLRAFGIGIGLLILRCLLPFEIPGVQPLHISGWYADLWAWLNPYMAEGTTPLDILVIIWVVGSLVFLLRLLYRLYRQSKTIRSGTIPEHDRLYEIYRESLREVSCPSAGHIRVSPVYATPMLIGFFRPHILFPEPMTELPEEDLKFIFRHELTHFRNRDLWIKLAVELLCCALWWNPAVYLLRICIGQLLEMRCDSLACKDLEDRQTVQYSETLLNAFKKPGRYPSFITAEYLGYPSKKRVYQRFKQILSAPSKPKKRWISVLIVTLAICAFISSYAVIIVPSALPDEVEPSMDVSTSFESGFILRYPDGSLKVFIDSQMYGTITPEQLETDPFCSMPIFDASISTE